MVVRRAGATARLEELLQIVRASSAGQVCCRRGIQATFYFLENEQPGLRLWMQCGCSEQSICFVGS